MPEKARSSGVSKRETPQAQTLLRLRELSSHGRPSPSPSLSPSLPLSRLPRLVEASEGQAGEVHVPGPGPFGAFAPAFPAPREGEDDLALGVGVGQAPQRRILAPPLRRQALKEAVHAHAVLPRKEASVLVELPHLKLQFSR